jgi:hypothetical protein
VVWDTRKGGAPGNKNWILGAYAGVGANAFITNGRNVRELSGPFKTFSFQLGWWVKGGGIQYSLGKNDAGDTIWIFSYGGPFGVPTGVAFGGSASYYNTNTVTTQGGGKCPCK